MEAIQFNIKERKSKVILPETLGFGKIFTDHMFEMDYTEKDGWHNPTIRPVEDLPSSSRFNVYSLWSGSIRRIESIQTGIR
ncbi:MAG: hypothetical protein MZV64_42080 [Ignavibacteriales bacterium]|nr:hypothetical protein [Ignavibacteriales bacterium]